MIELTPEWVLMNLSDYWFTDGDGLAFISLYEINKSKTLIELALNTLDIEWEMDIQNIECEMDEASIDDLIEFLYVFEIEDIKDLCPEFYEKLVKDNNDTQALYKNLINKLTFPGDSDILNKE